nr:MAG TPA: hypothetical protein [Caudoviricetes sp.]
MGRITLTEEQKRIAESIRSGQGASTQQAPSAYRGGRITLNQKQIQIASKYGLPNPDYGKNAQSTQTTVDDPLHKQYAAFMAYQNAVREAELAQIEPGAALKGRASGQKKTENAGAEIGGKVSQQEYSRSSAMQTQYGSYQNYLRGVEAAQGRQLGMMALQQQSAALTFRPSVKSQKDDVNKAIARARAMKTVERDQVRGMRQTSKLLAGEIYNREVEQADTHFSGTGLSENGKSVTQLQNEIDALQKRKAQVDSQSVLARAQEAIGELSEEDQNLLRQYRGKELNGYQVRAYAKYDAKTALNEKGYDDEKLKQLAEWQKVLDDYENAQKLDAAAQEIGQRSPVGGTLFSAALAPGKALGNVESLRGVLPSWAGGYQNEDMPTNVYSPAYNATRLSSGIRGSVMQGMNPTGQFLYQAGTSALDSAVNMAVSTGLVGAFGGVAGAGAKDAVAETMNWVMGSQVAADSVYEGIQNGKSNQEALIDGIVEGAIEGITEKYSVGDIIENMLSGKAVWKKALRSFASEGAEEIASNWLNRAYDVVAKHDRGEVMSAYAAYIAEGKTPAQALAAMVGDFAKEDGLSFLAGGLSGLAMSGTYAGVNRVILEENVTQTARAVIEAGEVQDVIDYGMAQEESTKAHQLAEELQQTVDAGGEVTQKAVEDTLREVAKEQQAAVDEGQEPRAPETLTRLEQLQAQEQQAQAKAEADEKTFQIYKSAAETAQENQRLAQQYQQEQEQNRAQQSVQAVQQAQRAAQQQYDQDSLLAPIPGTENMGELDLEQYARQQTAGAEQELDEAAAQQEEQYLQEQARRAGYDETTAAYFLNGNTTGMPAEQYAQSFGQVYEQGRLGASEQRAMRYAEGMNQDVAAAAYRAGLAAGQEGVNNGSIKASDEGQIRQAGQRAEGQAGGVRQSTAQRQRADAGRKRAQGARDLAKAWDEVELSTLGFGKDNTQKVRVMPKGQEARSEDIQAAAKFFRSMGVQNARFFTGQLTQEIDGQTFYADAAVTEDGSVLIRADSEEYSAFEVAKHEGYHLLVKRWPEMAAKIQKRLLGEGKITKEMIESYVDAYAGIYGDDTDAYVEEIVADTYAGMNRTDYGTNQLRADVKMEVGQWQKKSGSARAPPVKMSAAKDQTTKNYQGVNLAEDGSVYTYDFLTSLPDMDVTMLPEVDAVRGADNRVDAAKVVQEGMKNARAVGTERDGKVFVRNRYTGKLLRVDTSSVRHGLYGEANRILTNARLGAVIGDIVKNAVPVNALKNEAKNVVGTYAMAAYAEDTAGRQFSAIVTVEQRTGTVAGVEVYDVTHAVSGRQKRSERAGTKPQGVHPSTNASSKITIADFLKIVNRVHQSVLSQDVMGHFGEMKNPGGYYTNRVKFSASADQTSAEQRKQNDKTALDYFGRTYKWSETGYVLLNGARLDFSGRHEGGPGGYRSVDHRDIIDALGEDYGGGSYTGGMVRFMQEGNIRISPESGGINLAVMPTKAQMDALGDFISKERGEVILDIDDAQGNTISSTEFSRGTHANKVLQAIRDYFENGTLPQADNTPSVSQFRYSAQDGRYRDLMGEKAAQYVRRLESRLVNELAENLSVPGQAKREVLQPMAEEALRTFFTDGQLDRARLNDLFETAYQAGIEEDTQYIEQYGDLKKFIRDQKISISETDRKDIADYNLFRKAAMGTLTISKDGLPVDVAYQQLQEMAPELFPAGITAPSDQLMQIYDVARGIQKAQKTLDEYYGLQAASFKKWQQANFTESIDRLTSGLRVAKRYLDAQNKAKEKLAIPQTAEETKQMWTQLKDARKVYEKVQGKTLLTEADQKIVNRLLRGETSPDYVAGLENGQQILKVYEAKADYDMLALKLKAWNAQRKQGLRDFAEQALTEAEAVKWVDKNMGIRYQRETMERNIRDIARKGKVSDEKANAFINKYFWPVHENESKRKNYLIEQQNRIKELKLDRQVRKGNLVSESYAVQWLGEAEFNRDYLKQHPRVERRGGMTFDEWNAAIQEFEKQNPNLDLGKVRAAVKVFHEVYDKLFQDMNRVRIENGYEPVNYLQGYFPHFQENEEGGSILQKFARAAGIEGDVSPLPATINGLTANFKPGIRYMANIQNRLGYATAYDALQGFDRYIEVATDVIFHTADIQRLRALATQIRYRASDEGLKKRIDAITMNPFLNPDEVYEDVVKLTKEGRYGLANFVDELDEYTNLLAGKKSRLDRGMEKAFGRRFYNVMKKFESRVGANMVAANVGSALTNFIPITQAWSQVSTADVLRGMWDTLKNYKTADGLDAASTFINNRSGYRRLAMSTMDKVSAGAGWLMESIDTFTTGSVVRARYYQNLRRGMSETSAMQEADQFASGIMADRSKGSTPTLYSARNPLVKLFTQFQLEVNNELSWIFKDMAREERKKGVAALAKAMFKFLIGAWIYNEFYESIVGRRAAMDPLDIINDTVGDITGYQIPNTVDAMFSGEWDFTTQKEDTYGVAANLTQNLLGELPFTQVLTMLGLEVDNGRIAVASAIPDLGAVLKAATSKDIAPEKRGYTIRRELAKPAYYLLPPFGGGQARKLIQGGVAAWKGGSYSVDNEGRDILQYPVYNDNAADRAKSWAQALLFGKTATEEAQSWVESGFKSLSAKETAAYQGMTEGGEDQRETYAFIQAARKLEKNYDKMMLLKAYDISDEAKAEYYYQVLAGDAQKAEMEPKSTQERIDYMNEKIQDAQDAKQKQDLKDAVAAGTVTQEKAIQKILANDYAEDENKAYWLYKEWIGGKDYTKYGKILQTIEDGGDLKAAAKEYFDHGTEKGDIGSAITTEYKPKYIAASPEERKKLKEKLLAAYAAVGFDRNEKSKDIDKWLKDSK